MKKLLKLLKWSSILLVLIPPLIFILLLLVLSLITPYSFSSSELPDHIDDFLWYYLLIAIPFIFYLIIGEAIKIFYRKKIVFSIIIIAPIVSIFFSTIYFIISGTGGYDFGPGPLLLLMAIIHLVIGFILSIIIYCKG